MRKRNSKYYLKHKRQTLADFNNDCHRFSFHWAGKEREAACYDAVSVFFDDEDANGNAALPPIPEEVKGEIIDEIYALIDKNEDKWSVPRGAQAIADAYCAENFAS